MKPLRALAVAGIFGAASLGSGMWADLFGLTDNVATGQSLMGRVPTTLAAPAGYAPMAGYGAMPTYNRLPYAMPMQAPTPAYSQQAVPTAAPYGFVAYPNAGYAANFAQGAPYQYRPQASQPAWQYVQDDGQASVMLGRSELLGGPPLASPQVQLPAPGTQQATPHNQGPKPQTPQAAPQMQSTLPYAGQMQSMYGYAMPGCGAQAYGMPGYGMPMNPYGTYNVWAGSCATPDVQPAPRNWFGSAGAVWMTRDRGDHYTFSYGTGNEADQRTNTRDAAMDWEVGYDVRVGRYFNCRRNAIEGVYWGLNPDSQTTQTVSADVTGQLNGILNWNSLTYGGNTADIYVNVAPGDDGVHRLTRDYQFQNIELNLWQFCGRCDTGKCDCSRLRHNWLVGVRYFRFDENLLFASDANDLLITGADDELFYNIDIENHLIGFQVGNEAQYCVSDRLTADFGLKLGIYANQINHISEIGGNLGIATINNGPFLGAQYYVDSSKNDVSFLGEVDFALRYCINCNWTGTIGYRALAVTGVAMPADQIYPDLRGINDVENIDSSRALILHGGYAGIEYNW